MEANLVRALLAASNEEGASEGPSGAALVKNPPGIGTTCEATAWIERKPGRAENPWPWLRELSWTSEHACLLDNSFQDAEDSFSN